MPFRFNPITGTLDLLGVEGPASSTDKAITRWDGTSGYLINDSKAVVQDGGAVEAQGFLTRRTVDDDVFVPSGESWIAPELELELTGSIEIETDGELIII